MNTNISYLDDIRINKGKEDCIEAFTKSLSEDTKKSIALLSDKNLSFTCLFILMPEIDKYKLFDRLNDRNKIAVKIVKQILNKRHFNNDMDYLSSKNPRVYPVLKWIFETGHTDDCLNEDFEEVMDVTVSVLINIYGSRDILNDVAKMIFMRNKSGHYIHDLVWAFFRLHDPYALRLIAENIKSEEPENVALACNLLNINNLKESSEAFNSNEALYDFYMNWLKENDPFLYFTGECFQYASNPEICSIDAQRKYICKGTPSYDKNPVRPVNNSENKYLSVFNHLDRDDKVMLAGYSYKLYKENKDEWKKWINAPVKEQIESARKAFLGEFI